MIVEKLDYRHMGEFQSARSRSHRDSMDCVLPVLRNELDPVAEAFDVERLRKYVRIGVLMVFPRVDYLASMRHYDPDELIRRI